MVKNEINMFTIIETLMKIKASLTVLIGDDKDKILEIQKKYIQNATIHHDDDDLETKSEYLKFLERDERDAIKKEMENAIKNKIKTSIQSKLGINV